MRGITTMAFTCLPRNTFVLRFDCLSSTCLIYVVDSDTFICTFRRPAFLTACFVAIENIIQANYAIYSEPLIPQGFCFYSRSL